MSERVLFISNNNNLGSGAFRSMLKLCELLKNSSDYEPIVVTGKKGDGSGKLDELGIENYTYIFFGRAIEQDRFSRNIKDVIKDIINSFAEIRITQLIRKRAIKIIHLNDVHTIVGARSALRNKIKLVWHIRVLLEEGQGLKLFGRENYRIMDKADAIITISNTVYDKYAKYLKKSKLYMIYNGIDDKEFFYPEKTPLTSQHVDIVNCGMMNGHKGQNYVIAAARILLERRITNFTIKLIGTGSEEKKLKEEVTKHNLDKFIFFEGVRDNVSDYLKKADILIMSTDAEAFGRITVEAMMSGCLIIGSNSGATPEILKYGECGILYEAFNANQLADAMEKVITGDRDEYIKVAKRGQERAMKCFLATDNKDRIVSLYDFILNSTQSKKMQELQNTTEG